MKLRLAICALVLVALGCSDSPAAPPTTTLTVMRAGNGAGAVIANLAGIDCGTDCSEPYVEGTTITLIATPALGSTFTGWSGADCAGTGPCQLTLTAATTVTATFTLNQYPLTVSRSGTGTGRVTSVPAGVDCGSDCSEAFSHGTTVTVVAAQAAGSTFVGWSGACSGTDTCTVSMTGPAAVTAIFNLTQQTLSVVRTGTGSGTVTSNPGGLSCGDVCSEAFNFGTRITLSATSAPGSSFAGWSGGGCSGTGTCVVNLTATITVTAIFNLTQHTLTVVKAGNGSGLVTSFPGGVNCGSDCSESFAHGTAVNLVASAAAGSTFAGWTGGDCSGAGSCVVTVTAVTLVTATFNIPQHALTVTKIGTGSGTVTSNPGGVNCGTDCSELYNNGINVTLTASPTSGSAFTGWVGGGCAGVGTCVVSVTSPTTVTASFSDVAAPTLASSTPVDATIGVDENTTIRLTFSEPMNQFSVQAAFQVLQPVGVTGTFTWQGNVMTFTPVSSFACTPGGTIVQWRLGPSARDAAGNALAAQVDRSFRVIRCVQDLFYAESARDGYITNAGVVTVTGTSLYVGDYPNDSFTRGFVSFDFSALPSDGIVTGGTLTMSHTQMGTVSQLGPLLAEPLVYGTLGSSDFGLAASGPFVAANLSGSAAYWMMDAAMLDAWTNRAALGSRLQLRLRTTYDNHHNGVADAYDFVSGEGAGATRPTLTVTYKAR